MASFGTFALLIGLALSGYAFFAGLLALAFRRRQSAALSETARRAGIAVFVCVTAAAFALIYSAFTNDFTVEYVRQHSNKALPGIYKFSALWSGQEGSLLLWAWLLAGYGFVLRLRHKVDPKLVAYASVVLAAIQIFFLLLLNFAARPFGLAARAVEDGNGLNPLLQYPEMVIHPPMLYLGYVGFSVPFAFALGALAMRYPGEKWIHITRRWTMVTWGFLTVGVFLGMHWAYSVLGWGGYWGWDPVENASVLPWLTGTAFLHSVMMQEKRGMMKKWNMWLIFITFMLSILGTWLTRSGVISSVHAFAQSSIGVWFLVFLGMTFVVCAALFILNFDHLSSEHRLEAILSRESSFLFNNVIFLVACFTVLWGTLFPLLSEAIQGTKVTVGPPFFNRVMVPVGLLLLVLTGVGPLLAWRKTSLGSLKRNFTVPTLIAIASGIAMIGLRWMTPWASLTEFYSWTTIVLSVLVAATIFAEFGRGARVISGKTGQNVVAAMVHLTRRNTRRYGGYLVHFGVVLIMIGFAGAAFNQEREQEMGLGDTMQLGRYKLVGKTFTQDDTPNHTSDAAIIDVYENGKPLGTMYPEKRLFKANNEPGTIVAIRSTLRDDLYLVFAGLNATGTKPIIKAYLNPLVGWIWFGVVITILGTLIALVPNMQAAEQRQHALAAEPLAVEGD
ncbi:MAG: heme lyase CcmF/NrfE family subunit [Candidatus Koribacter versatilis]|uniref:Heme lyase CcmF/NrfE family subunit n=1 Tax=Candidatus Korobacter versatilis TaxID=658062 RepID=A0A932A947_9BACT|nr:heme lyase CcmF/NrfE family subunit [Candidatus Koribacter versatilis]